jgi:hypothetical protein
MMDKIKKICGTCHWHQRHEDDWECVNENSDYCLYFTGYLDSCEEWEDR